MQLKNYEGYDLCSSAVKQMFSLPVFTEHEINMHLRPNVAPVYEVDNKNGGIQSSNNHNTKRHKSGNAKVSGAARRIRGTKTYRRKGRGRQVFRQNSHQKKTRSSMMIRCFNSLRIVVPSVASNRYATKLQVVEGALQYIRELETDLTQMVITDGIQLPPELEELQQKINREFRLASEHSLDKHPLGNVTQSSTVQPTDSCMKRVHEDFQHRDLASQFKPTSQRSYIHDCSKIWNGLHKTTISDVVLDR